MKNLILVLVSTLFLTTACTVDTFAPADSGTETDSGLPPDSNVDPDGGVQPDGSDGAVLVEAGSDVQVGTDGGQDASSDAQVAVCAPFGYKACAQPNVKCQVQNGQGDAICVVPGTKAIGAACGTDSDCPTDSACEVSICRRLCQAVLNGPYGQAAWNTNGCGQCPGSTHYQNPRFPSWIGICTY